MPANLGMIAFGKVKQLEKRLNDLEQRFEEAQEQVRTSPPRKTEDTRDTIWL